MIISGGCRVHVGGNYQDRKCICTFMVTDGVVFKLHPQIEIVRDVNDKH